ncbi:MAG: PIN domain-containing protein [Chloroflexota bacterium]|nr:PIN domain-containing protein [Chloroflexota bacterium]
MSNQRQRLYWDACVWLSYINGIADRLPILDALLGDSTSNAGTVEIYTSVLSQVEVAFAKAEQDNKALDSDVEKQIDEMWADRNALKLAEYHEIIGKEARSFIRLAMTKGWHLRSIDAIHLATAKYCQVAEFHTYDERLLKYSSDIGFPVVVPHTLHPRMPI